MDSRKLGRNEPCWCGSGKKFKHCHLDQDKQARVEPHEAMSALKSFKKEKKCSVPASLQHECSGKIINAHTVSKSSALKSISENGHVLKYTAEIDFKSGPNYTLTSVGINKASTFTGFCSLHDKKLFSPIEDEAFAPSLSKTFLVTYRGVARELFAKSFATKAFDFMKTLDKGRGLSAQRMIQNVSSALLNNNDLTAKDLKYIKNQLDEMLVSDDYSGLDFIVFTLETPPPIMGCSIVGPTFDFEGKKAQHFSNSPDRIPDYMALNSFSSDGKGYIVLSWLNEHNKTCLKLVRQFFQKQLSADSLAGLMMILIENIFISPMWWNSLTNSAQKMIESMCAQGVASDTDGGAIIMKEQINFPKISAVDMSQFVSQNLGTDCSVRP